MKLAFWIRWLFCAVVLVLADQSARSQILPPNSSHSGVTVEQRRFFSASLQRDMPYVVVLPTGYKNSQQRYPVLYLLHGWQGDETNWVKLTHLVEDAAAYPFIIVTPRAENSWYVNSATQPSNRFQDYILQDLVSDVEAHYRTMASAQERAVAGLSMGGYGALLFALKRPHMFAVAASISGAFAGPSGVEDVMTQLRESTDAAYGPLGSATRAENNLDLLIGKSIPDELPYLFVECGSSDPLLASNRKVVSELSADHVAYEYHEYPGAHTWTFWDNALPMMLKVIAQHMNVKSVPSVAKADAQHAAMRVAEGR